MGFLETGQPGMFNRYAYTLNDPINLLDPDGRYCVTIDGSSSGCQVNSEVEAIVQNIRDAVGTAKTDQEAQDLQEIVDYFGASGDDNGAVINVATTLVAGAANYEPDTGIINISKTYLNDTSQNGTETLSGYVTHEGRHALDSKNGKRYSDLNSYTQYEFDAYSSQAAYHNASSKSSNGKAYYTDGKGSINWQNVAIGTTRSVDSMCDRSALC